MPKIEGYWDCPYCGNKAIRGRLQVCPNCGKTRAADTKFYMLDTTPVADDSAVEEGPDWFCPYCDSYNPHSAKECKNCGHPREASDQDYFQMNARPEEPSAPVPTRSRRPVLLWALLAAALVLVLSLFLGGPKKSDVTIVDARWEREIAVEQNRLVQESDWSLPSDAVELLQSRQEVHHYNSVLDHYETVEVQRSEQVLDGYDVEYSYQDMGNGYFEQVEHSTPRYRTEYYTDYVEEPVYVQVPVYETKYYYTAYRWEYERTETASGSDNPYWPELSLAADERAGGRSEEYSVTYTDKKGRESTAICEYELWSQLPIGKRCSVTLQSGRIVGIN